MSDRFSFASGSNASFIEALYQAYKEDPTSVDPSWQTFFSGYDFALAAGDRQGGSQQAHNHAKIEAFINMYRRLGHLSAHLNPLDAAPAIHSKLLPENNELASIPATEMFLPANFGNSKMSFPEIWEKLKATYCGHVGADFRELNDIEIVVWLQEQMEACRNQPPISIALQKRILHKLGAAEGFEKFLQTRYLGQKRFSLEGLDALIPLLDVLIDEAAQGGLKEVCMGMAHRGRLNVLANIMEKPLTQMLSEFEGYDGNPFDIDGDVKYHLGFANSITSLSGKNIELYLSPNPSHLEAVNPVLEGFSRSRQEDRDRSQGQRQVLPVLIHGDASFIGQGIVTETLNLSKLADYQTGGTIHIIVNNQIGFTTNPEDSRSCSYSSDISKVIRAPVLHVNADDPQAVVWVAQLAMWFRLKFQQDIVIDLVGYRRHGHNETDEPSFTQPRMYQKIAHKASAYALYGEQLQKAGVLSGEEIAADEASHRARLQAAFDTIRRKGFKREPFPYPASFRKVFTYRKASRQEVFTPSETSVAAETLHKLGQSMLTIPASFHLHPKLKRLFSQRQSMLEGDGAVDWAFAELLAFATLLHEGYDVRLSGQDCKRGTFSSRHACLFDSESGEEYNTLSPIGGGRARIINSPLSEQGCLGFEFGYSVANPQCLVLWEAQFGDFANGAQIIIDQFLVASEAKWQQTSSLVLLLPHGYEGMGPEHSSARPERFLQSCGNLNIQVCNVTTPAQLFHLLRRQLHRPFRKPLVIMTPKSLLRHPEVISPLAAFTQKQFCEVLEDATIKNPEQVERMLFCTGKIYYELMASRGQYDNLENIAIMRLEQLYPFPFERLNDMFWHKFRNLREVVWVQEEPQNMGAWTFVRSRFKSMLKDKINFTYVGRKHSGTTAEGAHKAHQVEQRRIVEEALGLVCAWDPVHEIAERKKLESL